MSCRCPRKRPLNETYGKRCQKRQKAPPGVSYSHLNKHRLINSLEGYIDETGLCHRNTRTVLPPKISPKLPESDVRSSASCFSVGGCWRQAALGSTGTLASVLHATRCPPTALPPQPPRRTGPPCGASGCRCAPCPSWSTARRGPPATGCGPPWARGPRDAAGAPRQSAAAGSR